VRTARRHGHPGHGRTLLWSDGVDDLLASIAEAKLGEAVVAAVKELTA